MVNGNQKIISACLLAAVVLMASGCGNKAQSKLAPEKPERTFTEEPTISVYMHESGETASIPLEEYLTGVVAAEMAVDWPAEALAAQAILARTFTLEKILAGGVEARGTEAACHVCITGVGGIAVDIRSDTALADEHIPVSACRSGPSYKTSLSLTKDLVNCCIRFTVGGEAAEAEYVVVMNVLLYGIV